MGFGCGRCSTQADSKSQEFCNCADLPEPFWGRVDDAYILPSPPSCPTDDEQRSRQSDRSSQICARRVQTARKPILKGVQQLMYVGNDSYDSGRALTFPRKIRLALRITDVQMSMTLSSPFLELRTPEVLIVQAMLRPFLSLEPLLLVGHSRPRICEIHLVNRDARADRATLSVTA